MPLLTYLAHTFVGILVSFCCSDLFTGMSSYLDTQTGRWPKTKAQDMTRLPVPNARYGSRILCMLNKSLLSAELMLECHPADGSHSANVPFQHSLLGPQPCPLHSGT